MKKPEIYRYYYYVSDLGEVCKATYSADRFDLWRMSQGNCFQSEDDAKKHLEWLNSSAGIWQIELKNHLDDAIDAVVDIIKGQLKEQVKTRLYSEYDNVAGMN